jgi:hypothetical protein
MEDQSITQDLAVTSSYEAAMDVLSSLIGQRKRSNATPRDCKKFALMSNYLKVG